MATFNNILMEEIPDYVRPDVFQNANGLIYRFCSGWKLVPTSFQEDLEGVSLVHEPEPEPEPVRAASVYSAIPESQQPDTRTGEYTVPLYANNNPYDYSHPEYNDTNPAQPYFVASGWISGTTTAASSVSTGPPAPLHSLEVDGARNVPVLSNYCVLGPSDAVPVGLDGSHPLLEVGKPCEYGMWVRGLLASNHRFQSYGQDWWHR